MKIILGSSSKYRRRVFSLVTPEFETMSPDINEKAVRHTDPYVLTRAIAKAKADKLLELVKEPALIVTADQVVYFKGAVREKAVDVDQAREFLRSYRNATVEVINGIVVTNTTTLQRAEGNDVVRITYGNIPDDVIEQLIAGEAMYCAGALRAEDPLLAPYLIEQVGTDESLQGIPVDLTRRLIAEVSN